MSKMLTIDIKLLFYMITLNALGLFFGGTLQFKTYSILKAKV